MMTIILIYLLIGAVYIYICERELRQIEKEKNMTIKKSWVMFYFVVGILLWPSCVYKSILLRYKLASEEDIENMREALNETFEEIDKEP